MSRIDNERPTWTSPGESKFRDPSGPNDALFRALVQNSWDVFHVVALGGEILYESPAITRMLGYQPEEMVGRNALDFVHPEDAPKVMRGETELAAPGSHRCLTLRIRHKDGSWRYVESHEVNLYHDPTVGAIAVNYRDITGRVEAEKALLESHRALWLVSRCNAALIRSESESELLKNICHIAVEKSDYSIAWVGYAEDDEAKSVSFQAQAGESDESLSRVSLSWSPTLAGGAGPVGRAIRSGHTVVVQDIDQEESVGPWHQILRDLQVRGLVCLPLKNAEKTFGVLVLYLKLIRPTSDDELNLLRDMADNLAHGIATLRFRAESRRIEQKIAQQAALLDKATDAIYVRDLEHRIAYWNKSAERLYGWTAEEALGRSVQKLLHQDGQDSPFLLAHQQLCLTGEWAGEFRIKTKSGKELTVEARWTLVLDAQARPESILSINTDVTDRKKLEAQFLRAQRTESIGTLAGGIAHDLNNVLAPIILSLDLLKMSLPNPADQELLSVLETSAKHGAGMVGQLLSFSSGAEGVRLDVEVKNLIQDVERIAQETFFKHIEVQTKIPEGLWSIKGDPTQLHQVLLNLCVNARDAMPKGGCLTISAENRLLDAQYAATNIEAKVGPHVFIQVQDNGTGIRPEVLDKMFDPFFTTKKLGQGTGLGLSTVLGIVKSHGGFLRVYTEPGKGTKFKIYLPATTDPLATHEAVLTDMPRGQGELILVIDDEPSVRQVTKQTLEAFGYQVVVACEGAEAVGIYARRMEEVAAVITDMMMPVMDGLATIQVLQRLNPELPIIAASGLDANGSVAKATTLGIKGFLSKPYTADQMLRMLKRALSSEAPD